MVKILPKQSVIYRFNNISALLVFGMMLAFLSFTPASVAGELPSGTSLQQTEEEVLIHHWNFNDIPNDVFFSTEQPELLNASSRLYGALLSYDGGINGETWDRVNDPSQLNARESPYVEEDDRALRLRNPAGAFTIELPTSGYRDVVFRYAVTRTFNGAHSHKIEYSIDGGESFRTEGLSDTLITVDEGVYKLAELDFSETEGVDDNPGFQIRLTMTGEGSEPENEDGNQRFNNLTLDGYKLEEEIDRNLIHYWEFNNIPNDVFFPTRTEISAGGITGGQSTVEGAWIRYDGDRWDRVNDPTPFNARTEPYVEDDDRGLRLRNPTGDFTLRIPTTGHSDVVFRYAVKRTNNGAVGQQIAYSTDGDFFVNDELPHSYVRVGERYILHKLDFTGMETVDDNPEFTIRITASGEGAEADNFDGNQRFNHITMDAKPTGTSSELASNEIPDQVRLEQNYPNPFNPETQIRFSLPEQGHVTLEVFDITGRHIETLIDQPMSQGRHSAEFEAVDLSSGVYLYRLQAGGQVFTRRMLLVN